MAFGVVGNPDRLRPPGDCVVGVAELLARRRGLAGMLAFGGGGHLYARCSQQRRGQEAALEAAINRWTATLSADGAMTIMQSRGIAAGVVRLPFELEREPHLVARGFWHQLDLPFIGKHWLSSSAFREGPTAYPIRRVAPTLGQDNEAILGGRLGLSRAELDRLGAADVIGTIPRPRRAQSDQ